MPRQVTSRGVPYPDTPDVDPTLSNNAPYDTQQLAHWVSAHPGIAVVTTAERNALAGAGRWDGMVVHNSTTDRLEQWDDTSGTWMVLTPKDTEAAVASMRTLGDGSQQAAPGDHHHDSKYAKNNQWQTIYEGSDSYSHLLGPTTGVLTGMSGTVTVPAGCSIEVVLRIPTLRNATGENGYVRIWIAGVDGSAAGQWASNVLTQTPIQLVGVAGPGTRTIQVHGMASGGVGAAAQGIPGWGSTPSLKYRIT